jgi:FtsP/CotA-like multicopper oxidase with cupredoxin domain
MLGMLALLSAAAHAASYSTTLYITAGSLTVNGAGGATMYAWGFTQIAGNPSFPGPQITVNEGDSVTITVVNNHTINHNFVVQGMTTDATAIAPGGSRTYSFTASNAGTYLYYDTLNNNINREMGLYGSVVVHASGGANTAWTGGPAFSFERIWVLGEMDKPRWNDVAGTGGTVNTSTFKPNYFLINGQGGFDGMRNPNTTIAGGLGQNALVRMVNGGQFGYAMHFHCNHVQVLAINGVRQVAPYMQLDVVNVPPLGTLDVLFNLNQTGDYPMHIHTAQMETANGVYLNGIATMISIQ